MKLIKLLLITAIALTFNSCVNLSGAIIYYDSDFSSGLVMTDKPEKVDETKKENEVEDIENTKSETEYTFYTKAQLNSLIKLTDFILLEEKENNSLYFSSSMKNEGYDCVYMVVSEYESSWNVTFYKKIEDAIIYL